MKRKLLHAVLVASMAVALSGCGNTSGINADAEETQKLQKQRTLKRREAQKLLPQNRRKIQQVRQMKTEII